MTYGQGCICTISLTAWFFFFFFFFLLKLCNWTQKKHFPYAVKESSFFHNKEMLYRMTLTITRFMSPISVYIVSLSNSVESSRQVISRWYDQNREDAYSRTGGIFIRDTAGDTAYSMWFNEVWPYASLNHNEYVVSRAVSRMKMPPVRRSTHPP